MLEEWNTEKNLPLTVNEVASFSNKKVWWILPYDDQRTGKHFVFEWEATVNNRTSLNQNCPYLSNQKIYSGFNDLETWCKENNKENILEEWDTEKNYPLKPSDVAYGTRLVVWWLLPYDDPKTGKHFDFEWQESINTRTSQNLGCPYLSNYRVWKGYNDLETCFYQIAAEWNYEKNYPLKPSDVVFGTPRKVWWKLNYHDERQNKDFVFEWEASVVSRTSGDIGCPFLSGHQVFPGFNDLESQYSDIAADWNFSRNGKLVPSQISCFSNKKVWWKCKICGHEWQAKVNNRTHGNGCSECSKYFSSSFPETAVYFYVQKYFSDTIWIYRDLGYELDVYIPSLRLAVEYDGKFWHKNKQEKDKEKNKKCVDDNITLWRIRELIPSLNDTSHDILITDTYSLDKSSCRVIS